MPAVRLVVVTAATAGCVAVRVCHPPASNTGHQAVPSSTGTGASPYPIDPDRPPGPHA